MSRRVVITGWGAYSPIGNNAAAITEALKTGKSGVRAMPQWGETYKDLATRVGGVVEGFDEKVIGREHRRSMGRVALLAALAAKDAVASAGLSQELISSGRTGLSIGQTVGSPSATQNFFWTIKDEGVRALKSTTFLQLMNHSASANIALMLQLRGRVWAPGAACASSSQAVGQGFETIQLGAQDVMICGGTEELHITTAVTFDIVHGTSRAFNDSPSKTPRPFDAKRDGLVVAEGAGLLVLEEYEHAVKRGAKIHGEILGFGTTCDAAHMSTPDKQGMAKTMGLALASAGLKPGDIDYVNAHATGTPTGDGIEAQATLDVMGPDIPMSSSKGHTGHTLAACGALELVYCLLMMEHGFLAPTLNLETVADDSKGPRHLREVEAKKARRILSNNFAFGGINTSLVIASPS
jgi:3-oxoacyl-[acyl-carrier-protein] synthase II